MHLQHAKPASTLDRWIHSYREYVFTPSDATAFTNLPGTGAELWLLNPESRLSTEHHPEDGLLCLRSCRLVHRQSGLRIFAIRFRAGSLPFFTDRPLAQLIDHYTPIGALWDESVLARLSALRRSTSFDEQCHLADRFLCARLRSSPQLEQMQQLATVIYEQSENFAVTDYAAQLKRSRSHLSQQFREVHGTGAKFFHRLCRFERFLRDALFAHQSSLAGLAVEHGYYDQAHMINDVRGISQQSPRQLLACAETRLFYSPRLPHPSY